MEKQVSICNLSSQEASGWPPECETEEQKTEFIDYIEREEGVRSEREKVKKNPGLRALAKIMLNSLVSLW